MEIRKQLVKRNIAGDVILVPIGDASLELKGLVTLNETGELLWDRLPQAADAADLAAALRAEYDVDERAHGAAGRTGVSGCLAAAEYCLKRTLRLRAGGFVFARRRL